MTLTAGGNNGSTTFSGVIADGSGTLALAKTGSGTLVLAGANTYTGATTVGGGTLTVDGTTAAGAVTVAAGATLTGSGTIGGTVGMSGTLRPGRVARPAHERRPDLRGQLVVLDRDRWHHAGDRARPGQGLERRGHDRQQRDAVAELAQLLHADESASPSSSSTRSRRARSAAPSAACPRARRSRASWGVR